MKKLILTTAVALSMIATANAQKNSMLLGGNIDWSKTSDSVTSAFNPYVGYQFDEHLQQV